MSLRVWWVVAAIAAAVAGACSPPSGEVIRVGHANIAGWAIYVGSAEAGRDLADAITREELDVVGVSEVCESQVAAAVEALGDESFDFAFQETAGPDSPLPWSPPADSGCRYGNALIVRQEFDISGVRRIELPTADREEGAEFDPEEDRWAVCGTIAVGKPVEVCTTHFSNLVVTPDVRRLQGEALDEALDEGAAVVVGDFNARNGSRELGPFARWTDAARNKGVVHVFVRGVDPTERGKAGVGRSDHDLVWASVRVAKP